MKIRGIERRRRASDPAFIEPHIHLDTRRPASRTGISPVLSRIERWAERKSANPAAGRQSPGVEKPEVADRQWRAVVRTLSMFRLPRNGAEVVLEVKQEVAPRSGLRIDCRYPQVFTPTARRCWRPQAAGRRRGDPAFEFSREWWNRCISSVWRSNMTAHWISLR